MITFILIDSWACYKSQDWSLKEKRRTFKLHICARWKLVTLKRPLKLLLQGGASNFSVLLVFFIHIIDLRDEIVEFREDRHNWDCLWSVTMKNLEVLILPFQPRCSLKNFCSNSNKGRDTSGAKQNLNLLSVVPDQGSIKHTILHGFDPLRHLLFPSPVWKRVHPDVPARPLPQNQENRGRWTVGCSWRKTHHTHCGSLATAPESTTWSEKCAKTTELSPSRLG